MTTLSYQHVLDAIDRIDPVAYGTGRNFTHGPVTRLSPYVSRGVISTRLVYDHLRAKAFSRLQLEPLVRELAWRDYWQLVWEAKGEEIEQDLRFPQAAVLHQDKMPAAVLEARTGIDGVDKGIKDLLTTGYVHNHQRMYIASLVCNIARCRWQVAARWMYYHLLDGDWASNSLSWQWVAGTNSSKRYFANQENINTYCGTAQRGTFLDITYEGLPDLKVPEVLELTDVPDLSVRLPETLPLELDPHLPVLIYNSYNLDPMWRSGQPANRILLLEPEHFKRYPVGEKVIQHVISLASNIDGIKIHTGDFNALRSLSSGQPFFFKQHPFSSHYSGTADEREWLTDVKGYFPSFFSFWKKAEKQLFAD